MFCLCTHLLIHSSSFGYVHTNIQKHLSASLLSVLSGILRAVGLMDHMYFHPHLELQNYFSSNCNHVALLLTVHKGLSSSCQCLLGTSWFSGFSFARFGHSHPIGCQEFFTEVSTCIFLMLMELVLRHVFMGYLQASFWRAIYLVNPQICPHCVK